MSKLNEDKYIGDTRYEKVLEQMQLLGIEDITTYRQEKNGTIKWICLFFLQPAKPLGSVSLKP